MKRTINIIILLFFTNCISQTGEISGKLLIETEEERNSMPAEVFAILKHGDIKDSIQVDESYNFRFLNLPNGKYKLSFSVRNYPTNCTYILELKENDKINHNFELKP